MDSSLSQPSVRFFFFFLAFLCLGGADCVLQSLQSGIR